MFSEILKIIPRIDEKDLALMHSSLSKRFSNIAKKFGSGLVDAIKGGGILAIATGLIEKVLNPLKEVQEAIDKSLHSANDLSTFAKQFNTTAGNLSRLQGFAKSTGLDPEGLRMLLVKFQGAVANQKANPDQRTSVANFVNNPDTAEAFFEFVQSLQKLTPIQQNLVQQEVFGERQILKASEFLHADFKQLSKIFDASGVPSSQQQTAAAEWLGQLNNNRDTLGAIRDQKDLVKKSRLITDKTINGLEAVDELNNRQENKSLGKFDSIQKISIENQRLINAALNEFLGWAPALAKAMPKIAEAAEFLTTDIRDLKKSRAARGMVPGAGKEK